MLSKYQPHGENSKGKSPSFLQRLPQVCQVGHIIDKCINQRDKKKIEEHCEDFDRHAESPTIQGAFWPIPSLTSCAGVTRKWGLLFHVEKQSGGWPCPKR